MIDGNGNTSGNGSVSDTDLNVYWTPNFVTNAHHWGHFYIWPDGGVSFVDGDPQDVTHNAYLGVSADVTSIAVQADGKILVGGQAGLARYTADGKLDPTFGNSGKLIWNNPESFRLIFGNNTNNSSPYLPSGIAVLADGSILVSKGEEVLGIFSTNGKALSTFSLDDSNQVAALSEALSNTNRSYADASGGKWLSDEYSTGPFVNFSTQHWAHYLTRHNQDGTYDLSFGTNGFVPLNTGETGVKISSIAVEADGKILVGGSGGGFNFARYNSDGSIDRSFNPTGVRFIGGVSADTLDGWYGNDYLNGNAGNDNLNGEVGDDRLEGGDGVDTFVVGSGSDTILDLGRGGQDILIVAAGATVNATLTQAWVASIESTNEGTVHITTNGLDVDLSQTNGASGYEVLNVGDNPVVSG
jgi:uncharacterized delta-60 repeat protein